MQYFEDMELFQNDEWILKREFISRQWLLYAQSTRNHNLTFVASPSPSDILAPVPVLGLDLFTNDCTSLYLSDSWSDTGNEDDSDIDTNSHISSKMSSSLETNAEIKHLRIILGISTCKRLAHFKETVSALVNATGSIPNDIFLKVKLFQKHFHFTFHFSFCYFVMTINIILYLYFISNSIA